MSHTSYSSIPYFLHGDHFQTIEHPSNLEEYLDVSYRFSTDTRRLVVESPVSGEGKLNVWNTGLPTEDGTDNYYAFHLEFDEYKPILSLIPANEACSMSPLQQAGPLATNAPTQLQFVSYLVQAIAQFYDTNLKIAQWPSVPLNLKRCSFYKSQSVESVVFCDHVEWDMNSLRQLPLPKSLQPYKEDVVLRQLSFSIEESRKLCQNNPRMAISALSVRDMDPHVSLDTINEAGDVSPSRTNTPSPLTSNSRKGVKPFSLPPLGLLLPIQIHDIDTKDCDALLIVYRQQKYLIKELLSLSEAQNRARLIQMGLEETWLSSTSGSSSSANNNSQSHQTRHRSHSQPPQPPPHTSPSHMTAHHNQQNLTGLEKPVHNLSLYGSAPENGNDSQFPIPPSLHINTNNNHFHSTSSVHSWDSLSLSSSPIISPRNSNNAPNIWSPSSPTADNIPHNSQSIHHHLVGMHHYQKHGDSRKSGANHRPRSFSSPLLFPGMHHQQQMKSSTLSQQHNNHHSNNPNYRPLHQSHNVNAYQPDSYQHQNVGENIPLDIMSGQPNHFSTQQSANPDSTSTNSMYKTNPPTSQQQNTSQMHALHSAYQMKSGGGGINMKIDSPLQKSQKGQTPLSDAQIEAKKAVSNIPDTDPIWRYQQWQLLEMYDKIKKDYPASPELGTESLREEIIYHMLRANFKWKCELCCRYNQQDPIRSGCRFRKSPWRCYFAHGTEDLRQKRKHF
uniref:Uncharacterized protein n=1 Tax=Percolomonas cosmopolitus TaxID=63605 RepID=A0A7S1KUH3_9EUKA|mmetsp:Transcript_9596/g.35558  ORF Transcript_9596/g.35558 Transcript_9596/m.35558 type:complete len:728 (+) Transcript_9596:1652-3835(+)